MTVTPPPSSEQRREPEDPIPPAGGQGPGPRDPAASRDLDAAPRRPGRWRRFRATGSLDIQSKLLVMLLAVSIVAALVVGVVGYLNGRSSLQQAATNQVTSLREARITELDRTFRTFTQGVVRETRNASVVGATQAFERGWDDLEGRPVTDADRSAVDGWYRDHFVPQLDAQTGGSASAAQFAPDADPEVYLQAKYTAPYTDYDEAVQQGDAGDGSAWSKAHGEYQGYFRQMVELAGYDDVLLMDTDANVVYSAYAGPDLGTDLENGPYRDSNLATGYQKALQLTSSDGFVVTDFAPYAPSLGAPTLWVMSPVAGNDGSVIGVMAVQVPVSLLNGVMTSNERWEHDGLGQTGESYIVGGDRTMRSYSRELIQSPKAYARDAVSAGTSPSDAALQVKDRSSVLLQQVNTTPVARALQGKTGTVISDDYLGKEALSAYAPLEVDGLRWVVVAQVDTSEAFAPVNAFTRNIALSLVGIIVLVCLLSLLLAQVFVRPIRRLQGAVNRVSQGELGAVVATRGGDEIGDLGLAFNDMSQSLKVKQDLIDDQRRQNDQLLLTLMPEEVAKRYKQGDQTIAEDHQDVSVVFADLIGFDEYAKTLSTEDGLAQVNEIWRSFDDAAARIGIERVRSTRNGYLGSCGLATPRVDNARRVVEFTEAAQGVLDRFNAQNNARVGLRAGLDTGAVTSGLVGKSSVVYDLWGDAVSLAFRVQGIAPTPGVYATQRIVDKLGDTAGMSEVGTVDTQSGPQRVWEIERSAS